jgi:hypothetical protein
MGKVVVILCGLIAMAGGVILVAFVWWNQFKHLVFGSIPPILFLGGLIAFIAGISSLKDSIRSKKAEAEQPEEEKKE